MYPTTGIYLSALVFVVISYLSINLNSDTNQGVFSDPVAVFENFIRNPLGLMHMSIRIAIQFFSFPFQFYIGKEFSFILYDEIKFRSISKKIDELKKYTSTRGVYTNEMVKQIDTETYEVVRQPYMKYSSRTYYTITVALYLINFLFACLLIFGSPSGNISTL